MPRPRRAPDRAADAVTLRFFAPADAEAASALLLEAFRGVLPGGVPEAFVAAVSPERLSRAHAGRKGGMAAAYVAEVDGAVVGYVSGSASPFGFGTLGIIAVDSAHAGRGVGAMLMKRVTAFWRRKKMRKATTCVSAHNGRALQFYLKQGFRPVGYQRDHFAVGVDEVILDKFLE